MEKFTIGIDLGGTNIAAGLVDDNDVIVDKLSCRTNLPQPEQEIEQSIATLCKEIAQKNNLDFEKQIEWVGIGTPGSVNSATGIVEFNANFGYRNWHLKQDMEQLLPCKIYIENDANAAAYGEYIGGGARGARYAVVITLGTGIGSGIIIDGKIFSGFNSAGAEIGHTVVEKGGRRCMCGRCGCWEKYASARALAEDTRAAMEARKDNIMWSLVNGDASRINAKTAFDGMRAGDELATDIVDNFIEYVACGITNIINIFQPEIICIGGGVSKEGEALLGPVRAYVDKEDFAREGMKRTRIVAAQLRNDAGIVGAASLGKQKTV
ncbi:MAG: ROK family protein [Ruthenibacterium sp.]